MSRARWSRRGFLMALAVAMFGGRQGRCRMRARRLDDARVRRMAEWAG